MNPIFNFGRGLAGRINQLQMDMRLLKYYVETKNEVAANFKFKEIKEQTEFLAKYIHKHDLEDMVNALAKKKHDYAEKIFYSL